MFTIGITFVAVHLNQFNWFLHFLILEGGLIIILIDCMIFLSPFQDLCQQFLPMHSWTLELSAYRMLSSDLLFKSLELTLFNCRFFLNRFLVCFNLFVLLFLVNSMHHSVFSALHGLYPNFKKIKICDVTIQETNNHNTHIAQYLK